VHPLMMSLSQAAYLDTFSRDACLFYLAFTHVDGTDGIANGVGQYIMSYVGVKKCASLANTKEEDDFDNESEK
jgi:hypothetical protein